MRSILIIGIVGLGGCGELAGLGDCVGQLTGAYEGTMKGHLDADMQEDGSLSLVFYDENGDVLEQGSGTVNEAGGMSGSAGDLDFGGRFDFESCEATGDWLGVSGGEGTWELGQDSAS